VRGVTGFAIGGIPPLGHDTPLATFMDEDLLAYDTSGPPPARPMPFSLRARATGRGERRPHHKRLLASAV
jgi:hypothetical protein